MTRSHPCLLWLTNLYQIRTSCRLWWLRSSRSRPSLSNPWKWKTSGPKWRLRLVSLWRLITSISRRITLLRFWIVRSLLWWKTTNSSRTRLLSSLSPSFRIVLLIQRLLTPELRCKNLFQWLMKRRLNKSISRLLATLESTWLIWARSCSELTLKLPYNLLRRSWCNRLSKRKNWPLTVDRVSKNRFSSLREFQINSN